MLTLQNAQIAYAGRRNNTLIENADFSARCGECAALIGINGAGKTCLLKTLAGLNPLRSGSLTLNGKNIFTLSPAQRAKSIAFVSTEFHAVRHMSVFDMAASGRFPHTGNFGFLTENDREIVDTVLEKTGLAPLKNKFADEISDGEKRRLLIARALAQETEVILLDEPASFLDVEGKFSVYELLKTTAREEKKIIIYSGHDIIHSIKTSEKVGIIKDKKLIWDIPEELILRNVFDELFHSEKIKFNADILEFSTHQTIEHSIKLHCENAVLAKLIEIALLKKNIQVIFEKCFPEIILEQTKQIIVKEENKAEKFDTFSAFLSFISHKIIQK